MISEFVLRHRLATLSLAAGVLGAASCMSSSGGGGSSSGFSPAPDMSMSAPSPDPRVGLKGGWFNAAEAAWNIRLVSARQPSDQFIDRNAPAAQKVWNSDITFSRNFLIQGNFSGYQVWDISNPKSLRLETAYFCPASQSDVSVYQNLLFVSSEAPTARMDCGAGGVADTISTERVRGIRIFDMTDIAHPKYLTNVQTCRGSHTHTIVNDPKDNANVYIYISGSANVRPAAELAGCSDLAPEVDPNSEAFKIEIIQVPLAHPEQAHVVGKAPILADLAAVTRHAEMPADVAAQAAAAAARAAAGGGGGRGGRGGGGGGPQVPRGPVQCHDITVYPGIGLAAGACGGYGVLVDIRDVAHPKRIGAVADSNFSFWHSATFNNDGTKVLFSDEWGGGTAPRCRVTDHYEWGADAIFSLTNNQMAFKSYYKMPAAQTPQENCVAHNGSLIPIPGRDVMVQGWYQGGISMFDWTDAAHPKEIGFFDRGPIDPTKITTGGSWSAYWYNGYIYSSEIARGVDVYEIMPSGFISQNEIDAAKTVHLDFLNVQDQPKLVWPASFSLSRAYLDQLARNNGQTADKIASARDALAAAEKLSGQARKDALSALATKLHGEAVGASDAPKAHKLAFSVGDLATATR